MARPKTGIQRVQTGLRLRSELVKAVRHLAVDQGRPYSELVEEAIEAYLQNVGISLPQKGGTREER